MTKLLMELAAKAAKKNNKKGKRRVSLKSRRPAKVAEAKPTGTIHQDSILSGTLVTAAEAFNAALANANAAGIEAHLAGPVPKLTLNQKSGAVFAEPIKLGQIVRRYQ